jgi:hypothetical protein
MRQSRGRAAGETGCGDVNAVPQSRSCRVSGEDQDNRGNPVGVCCTLCRDSRDPATRQRGRATSIEQNATAEGWKARPYPGVW